MKHVMNYKGYHASIEYDSEDDILVGTTLCLADTIVFEGRSVEEIREAFERSMDLYLQLCREQGKNPEKEYRGSFNIRIPPELHRAAALAAESRHISLNQYIGEAVEAITKL